jgi:hypothetical protein
LAAYFLSQDPTLTPEGISSQIVSLAQNNVLGGVPSGTVNNLAYNGAADQANTTSANDTDTDTSSDDDSATSTFILPNSTATYTSQPSSNSTGDQ